MIQMNHSNQSNFVYIDSSQDEIDFSQDDNQVEFSNQQLQMQAKIFKAFQSKSKFQLRECNLSPDQFLLNDKYLNNIKKIIQQSRDKMQRKAPLLISNNDVQILQNLQKRNLKYNHFLKQLQIDKKYKLILEEKTRKLKKQNERKKNILIKQKIKQKLINQQIELKKYVIEKKQKQEQIIGNIQKYAHKVGIQKIREVQKQTKQKILKNRNKIHIQVTNLEGKQKNQLEQLRQQLQYVKSVKKINEVDQRKALKDLAKNNLQQKKALITKCSSDKKFKV